MKKIMIAVIAIFGMAVAAFAKCQTCGTCGDSVACPYAYKFKVVVRTTKPVTVKSSCGVCNNNVCMRAPATRRIIGYIYGNTEEVEGTCGTCGSKSGCACNAWDGAKVVAWDYNTREAFNIENAELIQLDRIYSGDSKKCEIGFKLDNLVFGGFGLAGIHDGNITLNNANGFCAGQMKADTRKNCQACGDEVISKVWSICTAEKDGPDMEVEKCIAYGKWVLRWDDAATNHLKAGDDITNIGGTWQTATPVELTKAE